ncbi:MAG: hypothetical protein QXT87_06365 [Thermoproteota archaeon]
MNSKGQMRVVEALLASGIIVVAMVVMIMLTRAPDPYSTKSRNELSKYCYDFLMTLAEEEVFDRAIFDSTGVRSDWQGCLKNMLNAFIAPTIIYNMTLYNMTWIGDYDNRVFIPALLGSVSNASPGDFKLNNIVTSADVTYTTRRSWVLKIHLELARG